MARNQGPRSERPSWHLRWPFALAYGLVVIVFLLIEWRVGLLVLAWLPLGYLSRILLRRLRSLSPPSGSRWD